jgi:myo-inositol-1-phosphate synthase
MAVGAVGAAYGITGRPPFDGLQLLPPEAIVWGGWDTVDRLPSPEVLRLAAEAGVAVEALRPHATFPAYASSLDFDASVGSTATRDELRAQIGGFRTTHSVDDVIVINLSNPPRGHGENPRSAYAAAAVAEGCDFVEFTPTDSLTDELVDAAVQHGCHVAGRDGSTGQTFLKLVLADALEARGLAIRSWYSTNVLGNHDGEVLSDPRYAREKLHDKRRPLDGRLADDANHVVRIDFVPDRDDEKEAWDSIRLEGWLGSRHRLHLTWEGADSFLAAPMLLDLIRLLELSRRRRDPPGLRSELAPFFKNPLGTGHKPWVTQLADLVSWYCPNATSQ